MPFVDDLEQSARGRFVRWDAALWQSFLAGPAVALSHSLGPAPGDDAAKQQLFQSYLRLACEAIGSGYLYPAQSGTENVFSLMWNQFLPTHLARLPEAQRGEALAQCWNLGENLERAPLWVRRIFYRAVKNLPGLEQLEATVGRVTHEALEEPGTPLKSVGRVAWIHLGAEDKRFLPGALHYLAPRVVCVHDRARTGGGGREPVSYGIWLAEALTYLGPMGCKEAPPQEHGSLSLLGQGAHLDPRLDEVFSSTGNGYSSVASLVTSQFVVALLP